MKDDEKKLTKPLVMQTFMVRAGDETFAVRQNEVFKPEGDEPPLIMVRADTLVPMLVYLRKFFKKIQSTNRNGISRFMQPEDFRLQIDLQGFTPEDFNGLMSLANTVGVELGELLDEAAERSPQMARTHLAESPRGVLKPPARSALPPVPEPSGAMIAGEDADAEEEK